MILFTTLIALIFSTQQVHAFGSKPRDPVPAPAPKPTPKPTPTPNPGNCSNYMSRTEWERWAKDIRDAGGRVKDESAYANTVSGFKAYLRDSGASSARADEMSIPANSSAAKKCGISNMLPDRCAWIRGAAFALWADKLAKISGGATKIRNWYRPKCYNSAVGGASGSDHLTARSIDLYFTSSSKRRTAQNNLCSVWNSSRNIQVGLGGTMLHIGFESPRGKRFWTYASWGDGNISSTCYGKR
ncbi:MAG: D-Ala-D-Ala carboxypeptidase family metallohydrolase [Oligoflexia bacterium]|nr:D-Ala-D-Ala carboxypeptidase family metallohydrolase [Oligoflexia bacterium]